MPQVPFPVACGVVLISRYLRISKEIAFSTAIEYC